MPSSAAPASSDIAIRACGVTKRYQSYDSGPTRNVALNDLILLLRQIVGLQGKEQFEALKDVSIEVPRGTTLGIIGGNGSGKSTLLKLISRVTPPSEGTIEINGRIVSLLELGFGFRDDLSGRDNVLMSGAVYGIPRSVVRERLDDIVEFAGIDRFFDNPVRTYSSGMYLRLAFATAIHMDPDIILADEVLAVGDVRFRNKCMNRLMELREQGKTLLYVSHDISEIRRLSDHVLWLQDGRVQAYGEADEVIDAYMAAMDQEPSDLLPAVTWNSELNGPPPAQVEAAELTTAKSSRVQVIEYNRAYFFQLRIRTLEPDVRIFPRIDVASESGPVGRFAPMDSTVVASPSTVMATVRLPRYLFNAGRYQATVSVEVLRDDRRDVVALEEPLVFSVVTRYEAGLPHLFTERSEGAVHPLFLNGRSQWEIGGARQVRAPSGDEEEPGEAGAPAVAAVPRQAGGETR